MTHTLTPGGPCSWCAVTGGDSLSLLPQAQADSFLAVGMQKNDRTSWNFPAQPDTNDVFQHSEQHF
jgi:hypothetical protein